MLVLAMVKKFVAMRRRSGDIARGCGGETVSSVIDPPRGIGPSDICHFYSSMQHLAEQVAYDQ
jgi:hypothetical protein